MIITTKIFKAMRSRSVRFLVSPPYWISTGQLIIGEPWVSLNRAINVRWVPLSTLFSVYKTILMVIFLKPLKKPLWHVTTNFILNSCIFKRQIFLLAVTDKRKQNVFFFVLEENRISMCFVLAQPYFNTIFITLLVKINISNLFFVNS